MKTKPLKFEDIKRGDVYEFKHQFSKEQVKDFAQLTGDENPLHVDEAFGSKSKFGRNIVHGIFAGSLFSRLIGMHCPGRDSLYLRQSLDFKGPIFCDDIVTVRGTVTNKTDSIRIIELKTEILKDGKVVITGLAKIQVMPHD